MKRTLALLLALALVFSLSACFNVQITLPQVNNAQNAGVGYDTNTQSAQITNNYVTDATLPTQDPGMQTTAPQQVSTTAAPVSQPDPTAQTTQAQESTTAAPAAQSPDQMSTTDLLFFFNETLNRVKTERVGFKKSKLTSILDLQLSNSAANALVSVVKGALLSDTADETTVSKGQDSTNVFSPSGKSYVSNLQFQDINSIDCVKNGDVYVISVAVRGETNPAADGSIMSRGFDFMTVDDVVNIYAPKVGATVSRENIEVVFSDCTATLTCTADGTIQTYKTYVKGVMNMKDASIKKVVTINTDLAITLASTTDYTNFMY